MFRRLLMAFSLAAGGWAQAQLSPPIAGGLPAGSGAGVHSPQSPYAPLKPRGDVLSWELLINVKTQLVKNRVQPVFPPEVLALDGKVQRVQGFLMPLEPGERQTHFLLSSVPLTCSFCVPGGPESMIEVRSTTPVSYGMEPVVMQGRLSVLRDDPYGLYYRLSEAVPIK
jgi:hypothetical protein